MPRVSRDVFAFLAELRRHNNREWFNENKDRYLAEVRDAMLALIASLAPGLSHDEVTLKRPPRGFDPDHPLIEDLKRLSFTTGTEFSERQACAPDFPARFVAASRRATPLMRFLARALGLAF